MSNQIHKIKKLSLILALALILFPTAYADEIAPEESNGSDSIYQYNALENKASVANLLDGERVATVSNEEPETIPAENANSELQNVSERENLSILQIETAMSALQNRNGVKTFLIGTNLGILKFQLVQIKDEVIVLEHISSASQSDTEKTQIEGQIKLLEEEQVKVENFISEQEDKFSLFGWFINVL